MADPQIPVEPAVREKLRWVKLLSGSNNYSEVVNHLIDEAGYDVPEEPVSEADAKTLLIGGDP